MDFEDFKRRYQKVPVEHYPNSASDNPMVSVCVQTYQHGDYIKECLEGILMQKTDFSYEILLGEDASTDGTREICIEYAEKYPDKIRLFLHDRENNIRIGGQPTGRFNFIYNLFSTKGKYIALCEGDDCWTDPLKLQKQVKVLKTHTDYVISFHDAVAINGRGDVISKSKLNAKRFKRDISSLEIMSGRLLPTASVVFRKKLFHSAWQCPKELMEVVNADTFLFTLLAQHGNAYYASEIEPSIYRIHDKGIWSKKNAIWKKEAVVFTSLNLIECISSDYKPYLRSRLVSQLIKLTVGYMRNGLYSKATNSFLSIFKNIKNPGIVFIILKININKLKNSYKY